MTATENTSPAALAIILGSIAYNRLHPALSLAAAACALGRSVKVFVHATATPAIIAGTAWEEDQQFRDAGAPAIDELIEAILEMGGEFTVCQTGLILNQLDAGAIDSRMHTGGLIDFLSRSGNAQLVMG